MKTELSEFLRLMIERGASDLHITTGSPPRLRIAGRLTAVEEYPSLSPEDTKALCYGILTEPQKRRFEETGELDLSFGIKGLSRFRADIFMQRGAVAGAFRAIPFTVKTCQELGIPDSVVDLLGKSQGLIVVTGPTGSGRSTTLACMIDRINSEREAHIVTIEDPIEFLHSHKKCLINQREVDSDTSSVDKALKSILRQDPDVVMIGQLRDAEIVETALSISETGHLTLGALRTNSAVQTIDRIISMSSPAKRKQLRVRLSAALEGVLSQQLIPRQDGQGRVLAVEILRPTPAIRSLMREDKLHQIYSVMQTSPKGSGMQTMNQSLCELHTKGLISYDEAIDHSPVPEELIPMISKISAHGPKKHK